MRCSRPSARRDDGDYQGHTPERENHFDLAEEVQELRGDAWQWRDAGGCGTGVSCVLDLVGRLREPGRNEGMDHCQEEDRRRDRVEGVRFDPGAQDVKETVDERRRVIR